MVLERCGGQIRAVQGSVFGVDFASILMLAESMGAKTPLLADVLPAVEKIIVESWQTEGDS
ncbi:DUF7697 family protein [Methylobacterium brachythecii]|uniref:Uncharacterized protein n=1 Tax=Methylobacterium brachythecii TaxID=1176177 RepID=A0A7W6ALY8_9HYPH|nr:hypothetical protein [Methylobacterium brachythecii]MBB3904179.1 hypothetical protein [Methylobacterium brachythecii]GLS45159.1 hypothetical protein GCM10007884_31480 [Methylobacterium brachythecii]